MGQRGMDRALPSSEILALHDLHQVYSDFTLFQNDIIDLLRRAGNLGECIVFNQLLGIIEPLTADHITPEFLVFEGPNWRESVKGNQILSRNRATLLLIERLYGSLDIIRQKDIYLTEALTGFALWMKRHIGLEKLVCSEYFGAEVTPYPGVRNEDLCALSFSDNSFDIVICNELFEHVYDLTEAFRQIRRVLRPGGRLVATFPMAFGQMSSIVKARPGPTPEQPMLLSQPEMHGDPIRPELGSLVYRIPGWEILDEMKEIGYMSTNIHHICSWKYGILGSDLPGVLVLDAAT